MTIGLICAIYPLSQQLPLSSLYLLIILPSGSIRRTFCATWSALITGIPIHSNSIVILRSWILPSQIQTSSQWILWDFLSSQFAGIFHCELWIGRDLAIILCILTTTGCRSVDNVSCKLSENVRIHYPNYLLSVSIHYSNYLQNVRRPLFKLHHCIQSDRISTKMLGLVNKNWRPMAKTYFLHYTKFKFPSDLLLSSPGVKSTFPPQISPILSPPTHRGVSGSGVRVPYLCPTRPPSKEPVLPLEPLVCTFKEVTVLSVQRMQFSDG